jgi:hypothetical protein
MSGGFFLPADWRRLLGFMGLAEFHSRRLGVFLTPLGKRIAAMLFLVISEPRPEPPSAIASRRQGYWRWIEPLIAGGQVKSVHAKVGRGAVVLFDVDSNETLHRFLNEWADIIPARFDVHALIDRAAAQRFLAGQGGAEPGESPTAP